MTTSIKRKKNTSVVLKRILKGKVQSIVKNQYFEIFADNLNDYFNTHLMPANLQVLNQEGYYTFNANAKRSMWVIKIFDEDICNITILPFPKGVELYRLEMYKTGSGFGSLFMKAICEISERTGIAVYLIPGDPGFNTSSDEKRRRDFYHKYGFKRLKTSEYWSNELAINVKKYNL